MSNLTDSTVESGLVFFLELSDDDTTPVLVVEGVVVVEAVAGLLAGFSTGTEMIGNIPCHFVIRPLKSKSRKKEMV
jgi:hypothetical protein